MLKQKLKTAFEQASILGAFADFDSQYPKLQSTQANMNDNPKGKI